MDVVERLLKLLAFDSVIRHEGPLCDYLATRFGARDDVVIDRVGDSIAVRPAAASDKPLVLLVGHLDTVPARGEHPVKHEDGRVHGLGSSDMKAGVAVMWQLLEAPVADPRYDLGFVFYDGEEGSFDRSGLGPLLDTVGWLTTDTALAICLEPSDNVLQLGCLGTLHATVRFAGRAAHSARPWQGENAIHKAGALLARIDALEPVDVRFGALVYREVVTVTLAQGGSARNVVPDAFELNLNFRFAPGRSLDSAQAYVRELVGDDAAVDFIDLSPSGAIPADNAVLEDFRARCPVAVAPKQAWTDVARLAARGIDAINFGPGESAQAHQPNESVAASLVVEGERLLRAFIAEPRGAAS